MTTDRPSEQRVAGKLLCAAVLALLSATSVAAEQLATHWHHAGAMPPGAIGRQRLLRGPLAGTCQPVELRAPQGARIAPAAGHSFLEGTASPLLVGLAIGPVYRFCITDIPGYPGIEVYPTVELVDRLYPPCGQELRFPVPVELTLEELLMAAEGRFITRIIYLEDPDLAPALARDGQEQPWVEARPGDDPLVMADSLGRPMAILRLGGRVPENNALDAGFNYGAPQMMVYTQPAAEPQVHQDSAVQQAIPTDEVFISDQHQ